jgi:hypothetical protein
VSHSPRVAVPIVRAGRQGFRRPAEPLCPGGDREGVEEVPGSAGSDSDGVFSEAKGTKTPIRPLDWHFASTLAHHPPWPSPCPTSGRAGSSALSAHPIGPGRTETSRSWCSGTRCASSNVSSTDVCSIAQQIGRSSQRSAVCCLKPVAVLPGHPRPAAALAPGSGQAQVAEMAEAARPWPTTYERRTGQAHRWSRSGEPRDVYVSRVSSESFEGLRQRAGPPGSAPYEKTPGKSELDGIGDIHQ